MRQALFGFNLLAQVLAVTPAVMIFMAATRSHDLSPLTGQTFFGLLGAGSVMCLTAAAALTKRRHPDPALATRLLSLGGVLFSLAIAWAIAVFEAA